MRYKKWPLQFKIHICFSVLFQAQSFNSRFNKMRWDDIDKRTCLFISMQQNSFKRQCAKDQTHYFYSVLCNLPVFYTHGAVNFRFTALRIANFSCLLPTDRLNYHPWSAKGSVRSQFAHRFTELNIVQLKVDLDSLVKVGHFAIQARQMILSTYHITPYLDQRGSLQWHVSSEEHNQYFSF